jgi:hypothetical protein
MLVKGHSGFGVELMDGLTIRKSAQGAGGERLKRQIEKQVYFLKNLQQGAIRAPEVFRMVQTARAFHADMEFIAARDFIQFLSEADRHTLDNFLGVIIGFIRRNLAQCGHVDVSERMKYKLADLAEKKVPAKYVRAALRLCRHAVMVPVGACHGDLTMSNILFKTSHLYLIDFLDCYVESPLQDIVKLRQDTCFGWSLLLYQADFNPAKIQIALRYLDQHLHASFQTDDWYGRHYELFQLVNLMRVLPYCTEARTARLITGSLDLMLAKVRAPASPTSADKK